MHKLLYKVILSKSGSFEGKVSGVNVCFLFWPQEDSFQLFFHLMPSCKLAGLQFSLNLPVVFTTPLPFLTAHVGFWTSSLSVAIEDHSRGRKLGAICFMVFVPQKNLWVRALDLEMWTIVSFSENHTLIPLWVEYLVESEGTTTRVLSLPLLAWNHHLRSWGKSDHARARYLLSMSHPQ